MAALNHPVWFLVAFILFILLLVWLLPKLWRGIKKVFGFLGKVFGFKEGEKPVSPVNDASELIEEKK